MAQYCGNGHIMCAQEKSHKSLMDLLDKKLLKTPSSNYMIYFNTILLSFNNFLKYIHTDNLFSKFSTTVKPHYVENMFCFLLKNFIKKET